MKNKEKCTISANDDIVKDVGLGDFIEGYSTSGDTINWKFLWWLLCPFLGWFIVVWFLIIMFFTWLFKSRHKVIIYRDGFLWKTFYLFNNGSESIVKYADMEGLMVSKTRHYQSFYGLFERYTYTNVYFSILGNGKAEFFNESFTFQNENEEDDCYNALGYATIAISNAWNKLALERVNNELSACGCCKFFVKSSGVFNTPTLSEVEIGQGFIKYGNNYAGKGLRYAFQNGLIFIYPSEEDCHFDSSKKYFTIDINNMYNKDVFLLAASQLLGIR